MAVNSMTFKQAATLLNAVMKQMTGVDSVAAIDEAEFVAVATVALQQGYDQLNTAISQVVSRTIYVARAYTPVFPTLERDSEVWGGILRKVTMLDTEFMNDQGYAIADGVGAAGTDPFVTNKQKAVQFNFYGGNIYELLVTDTEEQLNQAFSGSAEFGSFMAAKMVNLNNQLEQKIEAESRLVLCNAMAAAINANDNGRVVHLLTEYKAATGNTTITAANYLSEAELPAFAKWVYGRMKTLKRELKNRGTRFHQDIATYNGAAISAPIKRHTPEEFVNVYMLGQFMDQIESNVLSSTYHQEILSLGKYEDVNFWQGESDPAKISVKPNILDEDGLCAAAAENVTQDGIVGVMFDDEAVGITVKDEGVRSIYNPRGRYMNNWHNFAVRYQNDQTENLVVFVLD